MIFPQKLTAFGVAELRRLVGHFMLVFGIVGTVTAIVPFDSTSALSFHFVLAIAGTWLGFWMAMYRIPPTAFTVAWSVVGALTWMLTHLI